MTIILAQTDIAGHSRGSLSPYPQIRRREMGEGKEEKGINKRKVNSREGPALLPLPRLPPPPPHPPGGPTRSSFVPSYPSRRSTPQVLLSGRQTWPTPTRHRPSPLTAFQSSSTLLAPGRPMPSTWPRGGVWTGARRCRTKIWGGNGTPEKNTRKLGEGSRKT